MRETDAALCKAAIEQERPEGAAGTQAIQAPALRGQTAQAAQCGREAGP